ncbi:hypothetical protein C1646_761784 [Rhizophagus diaphanus]|nr:hypothetical protein C1646_761784 [Rhizophagus diaphanus] [Rhizophagus sp. MUCL 43196]
MDFENYSLRWQNINLQCELTLTRKILNIQLEINSLREEINRLIDENTRLKNAISYQENGKQNKIPKDVLCKQICCTTLYQDYLTWCDKNDEQVLSSSPLGIHRLATNEIIKSAHFWQLNGPAMVKKKSTLESLIDNQRGTEWQKLCHKTWDPNNCRQVRPLT